MGMAGTISISLIPVLAILVVVSIVLLITTYVLYRTLSRTGLLPTKEQSTGSTLYHARKNETADDVHESKPVSPHCCAVYARVDEADKEVV